VARAALAELDAARREEWLNAAIEIAEGLQSEPMRRALDDLRAGRDDVGMLAPFIARFRRFRAPSARVKLHALEARVLVGDVQVKLSAPEFGVLLALALERQWHDTAQLSEILFEGLDAETAGNRLYVYVHRIRRRLGRETIVGGAVGYRLGGSVYVDLWEADSLFAELMRANARMLDQPQRERLARLVSLPRAELSAFVTRCRLPSTFERRLSETRERLLVVKATDALERGDATAALEMTNEMLNDDNCNEEAYSILIRAHLMRGERQAAELAWRRYRATLRSELGVEPQPFAHFAETDAAKAQANVVPFRPAY
jgi:DNA-binding SARP family transcriptional activator